MSVFETCDEALESESFFDLLEHCKEAVIDNAHINDVGVAGWTGGDHVVDTYLADNNWLQENPEEKDRLEKALTDWLAKQ